MTDGSQHLDGTPACVRCGREDGLIRVDENGDGHRELLCPDCRDGADIRGIE